MDLHKSLVFFYLRVKKQLTDEGFMQSHVEPCLYKRHKVIIGIYVDDLLIIGRRQEVEDIMNKLAHQFKIHATDKLDEFIGLKMQWLHKDSAVIVHQ